MIVSIQFKLHLIIQTEPKAKIDIFEIFKFLVVRKLAANHKRREQMMK